MNRFLFFVSVVLSVASFVGLSFGFIVILKADNFVAYTLSLLLALGSITMLLCTERIMASTRGPSGALVASWVLGIGCAAWSLAVAASRFVILRAPKLDENTTGEVWRFQWSEVFKADSALLIAAFVTIFALFIAPMGAAYLKTGLDE